MSALNHKIPPPLVFLIVAFSMWAATYVLPSYPVANPLRLAMIGLCGAVGLWFATTAFFAFGRAKTTIDPVHVDAASSLVTGGVYRVTRNPMYLALTSLLLGWAVYLSVPWTMIGPAVFALFITRFQIIPEEQALRAKFGAAYEDYAKRVRRWL
jgi:protein-S-isoprenylcysteine O-methyltransferase Ste14